MSERVEFAGEPPVVEIDPAIVRTKLGVRLARVAMNVPVGARVVDVGTDHARLPIALVESGRIETAIAVELHDAPFRRAKHAVSAAALSHRIVVRFGDGLDPVEANEADTVVLAGVGGRTVGEVVSRASTRWRVDRLVLQPNRDVPSVRDTLASCGYRLVHEEMVYEDGRVFFVLVATPGTMSLTPTERLLGPRLVETRGPLFDAWVRTRLGRLQRHDRPTDADQIAILAAARAD